MLKQLIYFQAVVRNKSFSKAADECYISQSAISQQLQALEKALSVKLLQREGRQLSLTPAGEYFYRKSLALVADYEKLRQETVRIGGGGSVRLRVGYLRSYVGREFQEAVAEFSEKYPGAQLHITAGNHEDLYRLLTTDRIDLVFNDQRRIFSQEYFNEVLAVHPYQIEFAGRVPATRQNAVDVSDISALSCILVASQEQQETERAYFREIVGLQGDVLFAENLEEARIMAMGRKGFVLVEGAGDEPLNSTALQRLPLMSGGKLVKRNYCAFWKIEGSDYYTEEFAQILKMRFKHR